LPNVRDNVFKVDNRGPFALLGHARGGIPNLTHALVVFKQRRLTVAKADDIAGSNGITMSSVKKY
jgi:hypothetical protein